MISFRSITSRWFRLLLVLFFIFQCFSNVSAADNTPWYINNVLSLPTWLSISGQHRTRYETVDEQFRTGRNGDDQILVFRTNLLTELSFNQWQFGFEILDSRQAHADDDTPVNTSVVNPLDVLQTYVQWDTKNLLGSIKAGRFTMNIGSRRFVSRNLFRNTINAFTGVDWQSQNKNGRQLRAFYTLPVNRLPRERDRLIDNRTQGDDEDTAVKFWGLYYAFTNQVLQQWRSKAEVFYFGLDENDSHDRSTRNRDIHTLGGRVYKKSRPKQFDYALESALQFGQSRFLSASSNSEDLDHWAQFYRAELGYRFDSQWSPRLSAQIDFASGDDDPDDGNNNRFDTLFGARRFDFGPTGIYGPFVRSNLISPGLRLQMNPWPNTALFFSHRGYWLASDKDAWLVAGVRDPSGDSGSFIGQQFEWRLRWQLLPQNIRLELGGAYLFKGKFANNAPNATDEGDPNYFYSQLSLNF